MQKRLLALVATVAVVLSMFTGIVFAAGETVTITTPKVNDQYVLDPTTGISLAGTTDVAEDAVITVSGNAAPSVSAISNDFTLVFPANTKAGVYTITATKGDVSASTTVTIDTPNKYKMTLATKKVIAGGAEFQPVIGSITRTGTQKNPITDFVLKVTYSGGTMPVAFSGSQFSFYLPTNIPLQDVTFALEDTSGNAVLLAEALPELPVRYNVTLTPSELEFPYTEAQSPVAITGKVTDRQGNPVKDISARLVVPATPTGTTNLDTVATDAGEFAYVVLKWANIGPIDLQLKQGAGSYYSHVDGEVLPKAASLTVTPKSAVHSLLPVEFTVSGAGFPAGSVTITLWDGDDPITSTATHTDGTTSGIPGATADANGEFKGTVSPNNAVKFKWEPPAAGTYTVKATQGTYEATATITVTNPLGYNFINPEQLTTLRVASYNLLFGKQAGGTYLVTYDGNTPQDVFYYDVYVDGVLKLEKKLTGSVAIANTKLGTKNFRVIAYTQGTKDGKTVYNKVYEQTFVGQITGWDVTMEPATLTVNKAENISFVIKDKDGVPVNNATIKIGEKVYASPSTHNAQDGTYVLKDVKFSNVGTQTVKVMLGDTVRATLKLDVVGEKVYNVTADVDTLLQGKAQDVKLTVTRDGKAVIPQRIKVVEKKLDPKELSFTPAADGVVKVNVKAVKAGELILRAENYDGTLCGEVAINVVAPKLVLIDEEAANVTDNFKTDVHFKVVDPRDDSVIKSNLFLEGAYLTSLEILNEHGGSIVGSDGVFTILGAEEHKLTILAKDGLYDDAEEDEENVLVALRVGAADGALVDGEFLVKEATIESNPATIIVGAQNNLTLTYKDANGNAIVGKAVKAGEASLGKTDDNGQVVFPVGMPTGSVKVTGATDVKDVVVEHTIKIGYDVEAPKVTYEVDGDKATLIVTDNVRLVRVQINGKDIDFWPGAKYEQEVTLKLGVNKFAVKAQDSSDLVLDEVVEIEYVTDSTVLEGEQVKRQGEFVFVQVRQFEELGAQVGWKAETKTATFIVGETKVEVTIGSQTAKVNGEAVQMPAAPFIANDRTYVPTRFIAEQLGWNVHWAAGDVITITLP